MMDTNPVEFQEITLKASAFEKCFYCGGELPAKAKEHIFNACLCGKHKTSQLICDECNFDFAKIDASLFKYAQFVMNALGIKGERHYEVPTVESDTENYVLKKFSKPEVVDPTMEIIQTDDHTRVRANVKSKGEARRLLLDGELEEKLGRKLTEEERQHILKVIGEAKIESKEVGKLSFSSELDIQAEYRSVAHMALKCLGFVDPDIVISDDTLPIRNFARYNKGSWEDFAVLVEPQISATDGMQVSNEANYAEIYFSKTQRKIIGVLTILNRIKKAVVICENYDGPEKTMLVMELPGGIIRAFSLGFKIELPFTICNIKKRPPTPEDLANEFYKVASTSICVDSVQAQFFNSIQSLVRKNPLVSKQSVAEYEGILAEFLKTLSNLKENAISVEKAHEILTQLNFSDIANLFNNKRFDEKEVNDHILTITKSALELMVSP